MLFDKLPEQIRVERPRLLAPFTGDFQRSLQNRRKTRLVKMLAPNPLVSGPGYGVALVGMIQEIANLLRQLVIVTIRDHLFTYTEILREAFALLAQEKTAGAGHLECPRFDLPAAREADPRQMQAGIGKIQRYARGSINLVDLVRTDRAAFQIGRASCRERV